MSSSIALRSPAANGDVRAKGGACRGTSCLLALIVALAAVASRAHAQTATFALASGESKVQFVSDAPLERITGATTRVTGHIELDPAAPAQAHAEIAVPVASIKTNNDLRDEHLRSDSWLDANRFPNVHFALSSVSGLSAVPLDQSANASVRGKLSVHGIVRELATTAKVRLSQADGKRTLRVQASFPVALEAHKVSIPSLVQLKVAAVIQVHLDLYAHAPAPVVSTHEQPAAVPTAAAVETKPSAVKARPANKALASSTPTGSAAKSRLQADDAGTTQRAPAADDTPSEGFDARQAEPSHGEGADAAVARSAALQVPAPAEPSPSAAPSAAPRAAEDQATHAASREQGCSAVSGTHSAWPLLLSATWLMRRRRHAQRWQRSRASQNVQA